jgi:hypothetical protein
MVFRLPTGGAICPTTNQNHSQFNAVFPEQEKMDRVGFEPTTSVTL